MLVQLVVNLVVFMERVEIESFFSSIMSGIPAIKYFKITVYTFFGHSIIAHNKL